MSSRVSIPSNYTFTIGGGLSITVPLMEVNSKVTGDKSKPVALHVTGDENSPVTTMIKGDPNKPVTATLQGNPNQPITTTSTIQGNRNAPVASEVELLNLPRLSKQDIKDLLTPEVRVKIPNYNQVCFNILGVELFSICTSGESQIITEPYVPNAYERCEQPCCEPDTRPFPERDKRNFDHSADNS
ncbi:MAG: hypothetical protein R3B93_25785 [Bacteroidia bacterium]